jgi:hypothetical protein
MALAFIRVFDDGFDAVVSLHDRDESREKPAYPPHAWGVCRESAAQGRLDSGKSPAGCAAVPASQWRRLRVSDDCEFASRFGGEMVDIAAQCPQDKVKSTTVSELMKIGVGKEVDFFDAMRRRLVNEGFFMLDIVERDGNRPTRIVITEEGIVSGCWRALEATPAPGDARDRSTWSSVRAPWKRRTPSRLPSRRRGRI